MAIGDGVTVLASDIQAIKDDVDAIVSASRAAIDTAETTTSASYTDLATTGPSVTLTTGSLVLVIVTARISNSATNRTWMTFDVSGATSLSGGDGEAVMNESTDEVRVSAVRLRSVTAGSNTFTAKYKVAGGTGTFALRELTVIPLGD